MVQLTTREEALSQCPALARYMYDWQQAEYEDIQDSATPAEVIALQFEMDDVKPVMAASQPTELVYNMDAENIYDYIQKIGEALFTIADACDWGTISFLLLYKKPWLLQQNMYPPVMSELKYLRSIKVDEQYIGSISASGIDVPKMVRTTFWLSRCNGALPYIHFSAKGSNTVMYLCKNGFLHFYCYDLTEQGAIQAACADAGVRSFTEQTFDFLEGGAMIGRQMAV